jgi:hypothetical protein
LRCAVDHAGGDEPDREALRRPHQDCLIRDGISRGPEGRRADLPEDHVTERTPAPTDDMGDKPYDAAERRAGAAHAANLTAQAASGGLRFAAYLPPNLALCLLRLIETGVFIDPSEAIFVMFGEQQDLAAYPDLRRELLRRTVETAAADPGPSVSAEIAIAEVRVPLSAPRPFGMRP